MLLMDTQSKQSEIIKDPEIFRFLVNLPDITFPDFDYPANAGKGWRIRNSTIEFEYTNNNIVYTGTIIKGTLTNIQSYDPFVRICLPYDYTDNIYHINSTDSYSSHADELNKLISYAKNNSHMLNFI